LKDNFLRIYAAHRLTKFFGINTLDTPGVDTGYGKFLLMWKQLWDHHQEVESLCILGDGKEGFSENALLRETNQLFRISHQDYDTVAAIRQDEDNQEFFELAIILAQNGITEIAANEELSGRFKFLFDTIRAEAPAVHGFQLGAVIGDGNCLQRALAVLERGVEEQHGEIRARLRATADTVIANGEFPEDLCNALHNIPADQYARWLLEIFHRNRNTIPDGAPQPINTLNPGENAVVENFLPATFEMWRGNDFGGLLWIYANAVMQHDGRWGELIDVALAAQAFGHTIVVHTANNTIAYNPLAVPRNPWHIFNNARGNMTGTHWQPHIPNANE
ncbi:MAG: hypothetical protein LBF26_00515, partial [Puniceicoccales bacterium]|nr:hypothetical protein [Puniceicoccales bacterium]